MDDCLNTDYNWGLFSQKKEGIIIGVRAQLDTFLCIIHSKVLSYLKIEKNTFSPGQFRENDGGMIYHC